MTIILVLLRRFIFILTFWEKGYFTMISIISNIKCGLTAIEKNIDRLVRSKFHNPAQYPEIVISLKKTIADIHFWIECHKKVIDRSEDILPILFKLFRELNLMINQLWDGLDTVNGKRKESKKRIKNQQKNIMKSIELSIEKIIKSLPAVKTNKSNLCDAFEKGLKESLDKEIIKACQKKLKFHITARGNKTYVFPWDKVEKYHSFLEDTEEFKLKVLHTIPKDKNAIGHKESCQGHKTYVLCGKRHKPRRTILEGNKETFGIRMVQCKKCGQRFSILPSFLPREKNYGMDIIGNICRGVFLRLYSFQAALESTELLGNNRVKSKQTILNWMRWFGTLHPALVLTRANVKGSGYLQEDEGFEKEPNLRTYSVIMVDPETLVVWHSDYVDHVDQATLTSSFEEFLNNISFKINGVTKDKWQPSTRALKNVVDKLWIGYCHRHCLENFQKALNKYQNETKCSDKERKELYTKFKKILKTSKSKINLEGKVKGLKNKAFEHPILAKRISELVNNATQYTSHNKRKGITQTTSIVDNFLKTIKRKLNAAESFRDKDWTKIFFKGVANARNFVPFTPGSKNADKSPFQLTGGETYDLPWAQVMNMHNAFLFSANMNN